MQPGAPLPKVGLDRQQCALVVVWTKSKVGVLSGATPAKSAATGVMTGDETRVDAVFGEDSACGTRPVPSTVDAVIYVTLQGVPSRPVPDSVWSEYTGRVLRAVHRWAVLPSELTLPSFGVVNTKRAADSAGPRRAPQLRDVAPTLSGVIGFTIDSAGALVEAHVAASSLSGAADTSMLVMLAQAAAAHDFPPVPSSAAGSGPARFSLVVLSGEPAPGTQAAVIGRVAVPVWHQSRPARLVPQPRRGDAAPVRAGALAVDSVTVEAVVDAQGRAETTTARVIRRAGSPATDASESGIDVRASQVLSSLRFEPAQIAGCPIAELVVQRIAVPR